jgi:hypothetical protein
MNKSNIIRNIVCLVTVATLCITLSITPRGLSQTTIGVRYGCYINSEGARCEQWTEIITGVTTGQFEVVVYNSNTNRWWHIFNPEEYSVPAGTNSVPIPQGPCP